MCQAHCREDPRSCAVAAHRVGTSGESDADEEADEGESEGDEADEGEEDDGAAQNDSLTDFTDKCDFREFGVKIYDIETKICQAFEKHLKWPGIQALAKEGDRVLQKWLQQEVREIEQDITHLQGESKDFNDLADMPQGLLNKTADGLLAAGALAQDTFLAAVENLRKQAGLAQNEVIIGPLKKRDRLIQKMEEMKRDGKHGCAVFDINRATLLVRADAKRWAKVLLELTTCFGVVRKRKNKFKVKWDFISEPPCLLYQLALRAKFPWMEKGEVWLVELQITTPEIMAIKNRSHPFYEILRATTMPTKCVMCGKHYQ